MANENWAELYHKGPRNATILYHTPTGKGTPQESVKKGELLDVNRHGFDGQILGPPTLNPDYKYSVLTYHSGGPAGFSQLKALSELTGPGGDGYAPYVGTEGALTDGQIDAQLDFGAPFVWVYGTASTDYAVFLTERLAVVLPALPASNYGFDYEGTVD